MMSEFVENSNKNYYLKLAFDPALTSFEQDGISFPLRDVVRSGTKDGVFVTHGNVVEAKTSHVRNIVTESSGNLGR